MKLTDPGPPPILPVIGIGLAAAAIAFATRPYLFFFSSIAGLTCSVVVCLRLFRLATLPALYRSALYVFITGNAALILNGWWADAIEHPEGLYPTFMIALMGAAVIVVVGSILLRSSQSPAIHMRFLLPPP
jgi:hypothetical protein